jgi:hypothetical protein
MDILEFISETYFIIIAVLYVLGTFIKNTEFIKDKFIPGILVILGIVFCVLLAINNGDIVLNGVFQGILCAGASVLTNQLFKQAGKTE